MNQRNQAEQRLQTEIAGLPESDDAETYLAPFCRFASALFDAEAGTARAAYRTRARYQEFLQHELPVRILEGIMPDRCIAAVRANLPSDSASTEKDIESGLLTETEPGEPPRLARPEVVAAEGPQGDFERFTPPAVRLSLRFRKNVLIRQRLKQELQSRVPYWMDQFDHMFSTTNEAVSDASWEELAKDFKQISTPEGPLWAQWFAYEGSEPYGIWLLRPEGLATDEARAQFSLLAARAINMLALAPSPIPSATEFFPHWGLCREAEEDLTYPAGQSNNPSDAVPRGLGTADLDAVDPCSRGWLELLRRESASFVETSRGTETFRNQEFATRSAAINDVCGASATFCVRQARESIRTQLNLRAPVQNDDDHNEAKPSDQKQAGNERVVHLDPSERSAPGGVPSQSKIYAPSVFPDVTYPPPDIWNRARPLINDAVKAWGFHGEEPEHAFWNRWLSQCNWHGQSNFLLASIEHCKQFARYLLGDGRREDATVFARVAVELQKLVDEDDARVLDLLREQQSGNKPGEEIGPSSDSSPNGQLAPGAAEGSQPPPARNEELNSGPAGHTCGPEAANGNHIETDPAGEQLYATEEARRTALGDYLARWSTATGQCPEASIARAARVDRADLSKWKKGQLPAGSDKKARIESVLTSNTPPIPPGRQQSRSDQ